MLTLSIKEPNVKNFMKILFYDDAFDIFEVRGVSVTHFVKFDVDGALAGGEDKSHASWAELKNYIAHFIKGKTKPKHIKIIFSLPRESLDNVAQNIAAAFLNMEYKDDEIRFLTATSQKEFSLNKEHDVKWDEYAVNFLKRNKVVFTVES